MWTFPPSMRIIIIYPLIFLNWLYSMFWCPMGSFPQQETWLVSELQKREAIGSSSSICRPARDSQRSPSKHTLTWRPLLRVLLLLLCLLVSGGYSAECTWLSDGDQTTRWVFVAPCCAQLFIPRRNFKNSRCVSWLFAVGVIVRLRSLDTPLFGGLKERNYEKIK